MEGVYRERLPRTVSLFQCERWQWRRPPVHPEQLSAAAPHPPPTHPPLTTLLPCFDVPQTWEKRWQLLNKSAALGERQRGETFWNFYQWVTRAASKSLWDNDENPGRPAECTNVNTHTDKHAQRVCVCVWERETDKQTQRERGRNK